MRLETEKTALEDRGTALTRALETLVRKTGALAETVDTLRARIDARNGEGGAAAQSDAIARLEFLEKEKIGTSRYWDYMWYIKTYHHDFTGSGARSLVPHGVKLNENPRPFIDVGAIRSVSETSTRDLPSRFQHGLGDAFTANPYEDRIEEHAERYRKRKSAGKCEGAVYTCVSRAVRQHGAPEVARIP